MGFWDKLFNKNSGQPGIVAEYGEDHYAGDRHSQRYSSGYNRIEVIRRGVDLIVDSAAEIDISIADKLPSPAVHIGNKRTDKVLFNLINHTPNSQEDINTFRRQLYMDLILQGNCFQYFERRTNSTGVETISLYHLPARRITIKAGDTNKVDHYDPGS